MKYIDESKEVKDGKDIQFKKSLGQNFIFDKNLLRAIANDAGVGPNDDVLEIGAGAGTLTGILADEARSVISFEIDRSLKPYLDLLESKHKNLKIIYEDFMDSDVSSLGLNHIKVIANIPYYITTPIVFKLIDNLELIDSISILIQKEVAERFSASPDSKEYGITSVILQSIFDVEVTRIVKKECFTPSPKVDSAVCKMTPHKKYRIDNFDSFKSLVKLSFGMRRKTLVNNLKNVVGGERVISVIHSLGLDERVRPEQIGVEDFIKLYELLNKE